MKALICGGGIGGLTTALCLAGTGHEVEVFEAAGEFAGTGAGLQLSPNATRVLLYLGLEDALKQVAFPPEAAQFRHWQTGAVIAESALGQSALQRYGAPYYHLHRGDLMQVLLDAARAAPQIALHAASAINHIEQTPGRVTIATQAGARSSGDILVGADGIHSFTRSFLWGKDLPRFTGNIAWRALVPAARLPEGAIRPMTTAWWGPGGHFVHYLVRRGELVNCVCVREKEGWEIESWTEPGDYQELKADFNGWHPELQMLMDHTDRDSLCKWALFDRQPMPQWGKGRITLLGDACHPTLPFMAQGAAMAIEDAAVLSGCLQTEPDIDTALQGYEALRKPRTARIQKGSERNARLFHLSGFRAWLRDRAVNTAGKRTMDWLYGYDPNSSSAQMAGKSTSVFNSSMPAAPGDSPP